ncbi:NAD(P)H-binding protein [Nocardia sp. CY41]|uniref:NAD(P)H-binding protein n=1 Tax=Nocardia sp. CY41 TaxID=2608686 RepID=UPI00135C495E|nr:NAD(P)H-binding protein [Nocardia sp. CY41]
MILVTGATGRPGSAVIREFVRHGDPVRALVRTPAKAAELQALPVVDVVVGDMLRPDSLSAALEGVDRVLMISGAGPDMLETQCTFIDAAKRAGVGRIVKFSGDDHFTGWDAEKFRSTRNHEQVQRYLLASGVPWTVLRPSQFMEAYFEEVPDIVARGELRLPLGEAALVPIAIDDIASIAHSVLTGDGHEYTTYRMSGPQALTGAGVAADIAAAIDRPVRYVDVAPQTKRSEWLGRGYPPPRADAFVELFDERRKLGTAKVNVATHRRFGIEPTTFHEFAARHAAVFRGERAYRSAAA